MEFCSSFIEKVPDEIIYKIASYLSRDDIDSCFNVCKRWRCILNSNKVWKPCCWYSEKYLKSYMSSKKTPTEDLCVWRQYYECETSIWKNWNSRKFEKKKTGIDLRDILSLHTYTDDRGNNWLFGNSSNHIIVWNITGEVFIQNMVLNEKKIGIWPLKDKLITFRSDYIEVYQFSFPNYKMKLMYSFLFSRDSISSKNEYVDDDYYSCSMRHIIVEDIFVGYCDNITNVNSPVLHIWDLESAKKIATKDVYQQSFADFVLSLTGSDIKKDFIGGLILFEGDSDRFLVTLIHCKFNLCQVSIYSLVEMRITKVIAQLKSRTAWCLMKKNVITIYHEIHDIDSSQISVYNDCGQFLAKLDFPYSYNPAFSGHFIFSGTKVFLKVGSNINTLSIKTSNYISKHMFHTNEESIIVGFFEPKYLLLCTFGKGNIEISVWDSESGVELWPLGLHSLKYWSIFRNLLQNSEYPGKLLFHFQRDKDTSILNFEI